LTRYLLDTHVFIWQADEPKRLSETARGIIADTEHNMILSYASVWEMEIKSSIGRLTIEAASVREMVNAQLGENPLLLLSISIAHIHAIGQLDMHHRDPFDRMLIAQAKVEGMPIITKDARFADYDKIETIW